MVHCGATAQEAVIVRRGPCRGPATDPAAWAQVQAAAALLTPAGVPAPAEDAVVLRFLHRPEVILPEDRLVLRAAGQGTTVAFGVVLHAAAWP